MWHIVAEQQSKPTNTRLNKFHQTDAEFKTETISNKQGTRYSGEKM